MTPRVLHLLTHARGGGTERHVATLCHYLPGHRGAALETLMGFPFRWRRLPSVLRRLRRHRPDVVFCYGLRAHAIAVLAWPTRGPVLIGCMRGEVDFTGWKEGARRLLRPRFTTWVANSRAVLGNERGCIITTGVAAPRKNEEPLLAGFTRPVFGVLANERPVKGHGWLLGLWNREQPTGTLVFGGKLSEATRRRAEALGVICTGTVNAGPFLKSLDALLIPSESESIPRVFYEARVRGVPVLATPAGGIGEEMRDGVDGCVAPREEWAPLLKDPWNWIARARQQPRRAGLDEMLGDYERLVTELLLP